MSKPLRFVECRPCSEKPGTPSLCRSCVINRSIDNERKRLEAELAETRAILSDLLEDRGESWLAQLAPDRLELMKWFHAGEAGRLQCDCELDDWMEHGVHFAACGLARVMRVVGGDVEVTRQVDAAHEAAAMDDRQMGFYGPLSTEQFAERFADQAYRARAVFTPMGPGHGFGIRSAALAQINDAPTSAARVALATQLEAQGFITPADLDDIINPPTGDDE